MLLNGTPPRDGAFSRQTSISPTYCDVLGLGVGSSLIALRRPDLLPAGVHQHQLSLAAQPTRHLGGFKTAKGETRWVEQAHKNPGMRCLGAFAVLLPPSIKPFNGRVHSHCFCGFRSTRGGTIQLYPTQYKPSPSPWNHPTRVLPIRIVTVKVAAAHSPVPSPLSERHFCYASPSFGAPA